MSFFLQPNAGFTGPRRRVYVSCVLTSFKTARLILFKSFTAFRKLTICRLLLGAHQYSIYSVSVFLIQCTIININNKENKINRGTTKPQCFCATAVTNHTTSCLIVYDPGSYTDIPATSPNTSNRFLLIRTCPSTLARWEELVMNRGLVMNGQGQFVCQGGHIFTPLINHLTEIYSNLRTIIALTSAKNTM